MAEILLQFKYITNILSSLGDPLFWVVLYGLATGGVIWSSYLCCPNIMIFGDMDTSSLRIDYNVKISKTRRRYTSSEKNEA